MNVSPSFPCTKASPRGVPSPGPAFTLIEMLVAMAVLAMMFVLMSQVLSGVTRSCLQGQQRNNNFTKARAVLDMVAHDLQSGVFRTDLPAFPSNSVPAFYTLSPGISSEASAVRDLSLVAYQIDTNSSDSTLSRLDYALTYEGSSSNLDFNRTAFANLSQATSRETAPGVVGFSINFIHADGTVSDAYSNNVANASNPVRTIGVTVTVIDDVTLKLLTAAQLTALRSAISGAPISLRSTKASLENYLGSNFAWRTYPASLGTGLRVFERYVSISPQSM